MWRAYSNKPPYLRNSKTSRNGWNTKRGLNGLKVKSGLITTVSVPRTADVKYVKNYMSLKAILENKIKEVGQMGIDETYQITEDNGYRQSNAERRLRESKNLEPIFNDKHKYIVAYKWTGKEMGSPKIFEQKQEILNFN
jgi:hypothetical protein